MRERVIIVGAGGHGRACLDMLWDEDKDPICFLETDKQLVGTEVFGLPVFHEQGAWDEILWPGRVMNGIGVSMATDRGALRQRQDIYDRFVGKGREFGVFVSHRAYLSPLAGAGSGCQIFPHGFVGPGVSLGVNVVVSVGAQINHDCKIGAHSFIGPGAILCGGVNLGEGCLVGAGAVVLPGAKVFGGATIPAATRYPQWAKC